MCFQLNLIGKEAPNNDTDAIIHKGETIMSESETVLKSIDAQLSESLQVLFSKLFFF